MGLFIDTIASARARADTGAEEPTNFFYGVKPGQNSPLPLAGEAGVRVEKHKRCLNSVSHYADSFFSGDFANKIGQKNDYGEGIPAPPPSPYPLPPAGEGSSAAYERH